MAYQFGVKSEQRDRERNEDRGWAGSIRLSDGEVVQAAILADGAGGELHGAEVAELALGAVKSAILAATAEDLLDDDRLAAWCNGWEARLQQEVLASYPGGYSTLSAAIRIRQDILMFSVGDSPVFLVAEDGVHRVFDPHTRAIEKLRQGVAEDDIPPDEYGMLVRAVGAAPDDGFPLLDRRRFRISPGEPPQWIVMGSDGVFNYVGGSALMRVVDDKQHGGAGGIASGLLALSLANGRSQGGYALDNATVVVLGINQRLTAGKWPGFFFSTAKRLAVSRQSLMALCVVLLALMGYLTFWAVRHHPVGAPVPDHVDGYAFLMAGTRPPGGRTWSRESGGWYPRNGAIRIEGVSAPMSIANGIIRTGTNEIDGRRFKVASMDFSGSLVKGEERAPVHPGITVYWMVPAVSPESAPDGHSGEGDSPRKSKKTEPSMGGGTPPAGNQENRPDDGDGGEVGPETTEGHPAGEGEAGTPQTQPGTEERNPVPHDVEGHRGGTVAVDEGTADGEAVPPPVQNPPDNGNGQ